MVVLLRGRWRIEGLQPSCLGTLGTARRFEDRHYLEEAGTLGGIPIPDFHKVSMPLCLCRFDGIYPNLSAVVEDALASKSSPHAYGHVEVCPEDC